MRVTFLYGKVGSGKTAHAVFKAYKDYILHKRRVVTNMKSLNIPNTVHISPRDILYSLSPDDNELVDRLLEKLNPNLKTNTYDGKAKELLNNKSIKKTLLLDEIGKWWDSRNSYSWLNRFIAYFVDQSRKRNLNLIFTDQHIGALDLRGRQSVDEIIRCVCQYFPDTEVPYMFHYWVEDTDFQTLRYYKISPEDLTYVYPLYDTNEHIVPAEMLLSQ